MTSFAHLAWKSAVLQKPADIVDGKRSSAWSKLADVMVTPLMPVSSETIRRMELQSPTKVYEVYLQSETRLAISEGCSVVVDGETYLVKGVSPWDDFRGQTTYQLVIEDVINR
ncbi:hypothetical protein ADN00_15710 [Ornatilinea apprima]|uniref:Phage head-tail adapter protein n=1 Tax=Ornatilinea apprima TaxID=1134406 RepID=A0A0P6XAR8_9CHLR|nr:hypothetical protein [Ornatilinea apprima]KPL72262.1 hypothetical protein ADN00_15710 [Ornatilinea apprima]